MPADPAFETALEALLAGRRLVDVPAGSGGDADRLEPLRVMDAIARANRTVLFGEDSTPDGRDAASGSRWGHLEVGEELGRGASGTVHRAWDPRLSREVALKLFAADEAGAGEAALAEGRLLARLRHPHIVTVYGADTHGGVAGIWMELVRGDTLDEVLDRDGPFAAVEVLLVGIDLAGALAAVHAAGLLHRDVKARNVIRERGGRVLLMDLGAGRPLDHVPPSGDTTGTPIYMAPEVLAGAAASERSDIYGLGVVLYRLLTGAYPVTASTLADLRAAHAAGRRTPLERACPDLPPNVRDAIERACDPDPERRFGGAAELERALREAFREAVTLGTPVRGVAARQWARWRQRVVGAVAGVVLVVAAAWASWDTAAAREARRALALPVPPLSTLYLSANGGLVVVEGHRVRAVAGNPAMALAIAVSPDLGIRTLAGAPPWTNGATFTLDGRAAPGPRAASPGLCCFSDGTTDGEFNYAARQDSTLLDPIGSRPLAPRELYRFARDWSDARPIFPLTPSGQYAGVAFSQRSGTFWTARNEPGESVLEQWSREGQLISAQRIESSSAGLAVDPRDGTLWVVRHMPARATIRLDNFDPTGRFLAQYAATMPLAALGVAGAEFAWSGQR